jgi:hypothetical protein
MAEERGITGRQLLGALPSDVRKTHKMESIRACKPTDPVLDTIKSSRLDNKGYRLILVSYSKRWKTGM